MLYPVLVTLAITIPVVFLLRKVQGKKDIDIGPIQFNDRMPFIALGCLVYAVISLAFFYDPAPVPSGVPSPQQQRQLEPQPEPAEQPFKITFPASRSR